jgi:hypothetical protein
MKVSLSRVVTAFAISMLVLLLVGEGVRTPAVAQGQAPLTIPRSWGTLKGSIGTSLIFEDSTGTIHLLPIRYEGNIARSLELRRN